MNAILSISLLTVGFVAYHFITQSEAIQSSLMKRWGPEKGPVNLIYFQRMTGVFFYGLLPVVAMIIQGLDFQEFGINFQHMSTTLMWIVGLGIPVTILTYVTSKSVENLAMYPQIRVLPPWGTGLLVGSAFTWVAYLLAYEFIFRGFLLFSCEAEMGKWLAIVVNVALYVLVHVPKGWREAVGAAPLGVVLCLLTLQTGNIWIAVGVHVVMALSNEWFSLYYRRKLSKSGSV